MGVKHERLYDEVAELGVKRVKLEVHGTADFCSGGVGQFNYGLPSHYHNAKGLLVVTKAIVTAAFFNMANLNLKGSSLPKLTLIEISSSGKKCGKEHFIWLRGG